MTDRRTARRLVAGAAALLVLGSAPAAAAPAQVAEPLVAVTASPGSAFTATDCKGVSRTEVVSVIEVTLSRTGDTADPLTVTLSLGGSSVAESGLPTQATIPSGASTVQLQASEMETGVVTIDVVDGAGYAVGDPGSATGFVTPGVADLGCNIGSVLSEQTIEVGTTPAAVDVVEVAYGPPADLARSVEGEAPPGTTFHLDGTWEGTATEVGTYDLREYFCEDDGWCPYRADIRVIVVPDGEDPPTTPPTPPAAAPVTGAPDFTG